ncbi:MAG: hypothetical protein ACKO15_09230, partial [Burkholderiales bacterium]
MNFTVYKTACFPLPPQLSNQPQLIRRSTCFWLAMLIFFATFFWSQQVVANEPVTKPAKAEIE